MMVKIKCEKANKKLHNGAVKMKTTEKRQRVEEK